LSTLPTIAIVDDDESVREAMGSLVRSLGYRAVTFPSAEAFLDTAGTTDAACVIADIRMEGMSGLDLQARLSADGRILPMIFITAYPDERVESRARQAGAVGYLAKPLVDTQLVACLLAALGYAPPYTEV
jgi:FixJ family two-component response regulator